MFHWDHLPLSAWRVPARLRVGERLESKASSTEPTHQEVGRIFERDALTGAFGASRLFASKSRWGLSPAASAARRRPDFGTSLRASRRGVRRRVVGDGERGRPAAGMDALPACGRPGTAREHSRARAWNTARALGAHINVAVEQLDYEPVGLDRLRRLARGARRRTLPAGGDGPSRESCTSSRAQTNGPRRRRRRQNPPPSSCASKSSPTSTWSSRATPSPRSPLTPSSSSSRATSPRCRPAGPARPRDAGPGPSASSTSRGTTSFTARRLTSHVARLLTTAGATKG